MATCRRLPPRPVPLSLGERCERITRRQCIVAGTITLCGMLLLLISQANGSGGAFAADFLRSTIGPGPTAQVEGVYLAISDTCQQLLFHAGVEGVSSPWRVSGRPSGRNHSTATGSVRYAPRIRQPVPLRTVVSPALPGEGVWTSIAGPASRRNRVPVMAKAFIRPDPARPYAIATFLRFDLCSVSLHLVAGTNEPGGPVGRHGHGVVPSRDRRPGDLLAAFNGGFKYADGTYGMMVDHRLYVRPIRNAATVAITSSGRVFIGAWGRDPRLTLANPRLVSWRQNGALLIDHGAINPLAANGGAWGTTVLNRAYTWRSALGITRQHMLLYVAGNALSVSTLARTLREAGAREAMELDINPYWVRAFVYGEDRTGHLTVTMLRPDMHGDTSGFLRPYSRDFFYITRHVSHH